MKKMLMIAFSLCAAATLFAAEAAEMLEALAKGHITGVTGVKKYPDGSIKSLLIVGRAPINRILDSDDAEASAREDAAINASAAFSEYLDKVVTVARRSTNTTKTTAAPFFIIIYAGAYTICGWTGLLPAFFFEDED